jgi:hypothetical protein
MHLALKPLALLVRVPVSRRGGLRTPAMAPSLHRGMSPVGHRVIGNHPVGMKSLGLRTALPPGRGDRAPPRKPPLTLSPGSPARPSCPGWPSPRRGGLRTPAITPLVSPEHVPGRPPGHRQRMWWKRNASALVRPCHADAESASLSVLSLGVLLRLR